MEKKIQCYNKPFIPQKLNKTGSKKSQVLKNKHNSKNITTKSYNSHDLPLWRHYGTWGTWGPVVSIFQTHFRLDTGLDGFFTPVIIEVLAAYPEIWKTKLFLFW